MRWVTPVRTASPDIPSVPLHGHDRSEEYPYGAEDSGYGRYSGVDLVNPRFDKLAEVYGARGFYVERPADIADALQTALGTAGPSAIEIPVAEYFPLPDPTPADPAR